MGQDLPDGLKSQGPDSQGLVIDRNSHGALLPTATNRLLGALSAGGGSELQFSPINYRAVVALIGRMMLKVVPLPTSEATSMRPWWCSTISLQMASPRPVPLASPRRVVPL